MCLIRQHSHLKYLKAIYIQHSNVELLMVFNHGFIDCLQKTRTLCSVNGLFHHYLLVTKQCRCKRLLPLPSSQKPESAELWRERHAWNTPVPHSASHLWTLICLPTCRPSYGWWVFLSDGPDWCPTEKQETLELWQRKGQKHTKKNSVKVRSKIL